MPGPDYPYGRLEKVLALKTLSLGAVFQSVDFSATTALQYKSKQGLGHPSLQGDCSQSMPWQILQQLRVSSWPHKRHDMRAPSFKGFSLLVGIIVSLINADNTGS